MSSNERIVRMIGAFGTAVLIALQGYKKKSLSFDGAIAAALVGGITLSVTWRCLSSPLSLPCPYPQFPLIDTTL
eukprot:1058068-Amorphochlora_amoeboformis.AAC.2